MSPPKAHRQSPAEARARKLAQALRANLHRRKEQARARRAAGEPAAGESSRGPAGGGAAGPG